MKPTRKKSGPTGPKGITINMMKAALKKNAGVMSLAARDLGLDRSSVSERISKHPELQEWCRQIDQEMGDAAEAVVKKDIIGGEVKTAKWYLALKHADRGYRAQTALTNPDGSALQPAPPVTINISYIGEKPEDEVL